VIKGMYALISLAHAICPTHVILLD
jgi:hypothetical protein